MRCPCGGAGGGKPPLPPQPPPSLVQYCADLSANRVPHTKAPMEFPMYVVTVPELLRMKEARSHQVLLQEGAIHRYDRSLGPAAFISHQWCSKRHPDPRMEQLSVLQRVLRRLAVGDLRIEVNFASMAMYGTKPTLKLRDVQPLSSGCVWFDFFSVPQRDTRPLDVGVVPPTWNSQASDDSFSMDSDMGKAVFSIPAYVESCQFFLVLAPPVPHAEVAECVLDYRSWQDRGWCRLERFARMLSPVDTHILLLSREDTLYQIRGEETLVDPVGEGCFTIKRDLARIAPVMVALMQRKLQMLLESNDLHAYRRMLGVRGMLLRGLPGVSPNSVFALRFKATAPEAPANAEQMAAAFLRLYGFQSVLDRAESGVYPITFAGRDATLPMLQALLECRADIHAREVADEPEYLVVSMSTLLHAASGNVEGASIARFLVQHGVDVDARTKNGATPLMSAAFTGRADVVAALLEMKASMSCALPLGGSTPLHMAALRGRPQICAQLIEARAAAAPSDEGISPIFVAAMLGGGRRTIEVLLTAPDADFEKPLQAKRLSVLGLLLAMLSLPKRVWGSRAFLAIMAHEAPGMTPLMIAAAVGNINAALALIAAGANVSARNSRGRTAAELAELAGLSPANVAYLRGPVATKAKLSEIEDYN